MKSRFLTLIIPALLGLALVACQEQAPSQPAPTTEFAKPGRAVETPVCHKCDSTPAAHDESACASDRLVKTHCIAGWTADWAKDLHSKHIDTTKNTQRTFSKANLDLLHTACPTCNVRIYFGLEITPTDTGVALILTNVDASACDDKYYQGKKVLVHRWIDGKDKQGFVDTTTARPWVQNWSRIFYHGEQTAYLPTTSFTMSGGKFWAIVEKSTTAITCTLASHKVDNACGIAVYGPWPDGPAQRTTMDIVIRPDNGPQNAREKELLDFAMPCPKACGLSAL